VYCVAQCQSVPRHFRTSAEMSGQFGTGAEVSYGHFGTSAEMSWVRSVLGPKCLDTILPNSLPVGLLQMAYNDTEHQ